MTSMNRQPVQQDATPGRHTAHDDQEFQRYQRMTEEEKQAFVKNDFEQRNPIDPYATSRDHNARELEIDSIRRQLTHKGQLIDLGCGNGYTLISLARELSGWDLVGIDFASNLINGASKLLEERRHQLASTPKFICADAIGYIKDCPAESADYLLTERFVQNMPTVDVQRLIIREAHRVLRPAGKLMLCEGSEDAFQALNDLRTSVGLNAIPASSKDNVSAIRLKDGEIESFAQELGFRLKAKLGYSMYFVITRVLHPLLVAPDAPKFDAKINDLARTIQSRAPYEPGYGSNVLWVFEKTPV